jgi:hypothetical protein
LLLFAEAEPEDPELIQGTFGKVDLVQFKSDLFFNIGALLL